MNSQAKTRSFWNRLGTNAEKARLAADIVGQARNHYGGTHFSVGLRFLKAYLKRFSPSEIVELDLLDGSKPAHYVSKFISKENMVRLQQSFNPVELTNQTENKLDFERLCMEAGLPSARTAATVETRPRISVSLNGQEIAGGDVMNALAAKLPPGAYVIKPRDGAYGRGVLVFFCGDNDPQCLGTTLKEHLDRYGDFDSWLIQPKLINHEDVTRISPSSALQTVRLVTYVDGNRDVRILLAGWRLADEKAQFDNFGGSSKSNVYCEIDPVDGTVYKCFMRSCHPFGFGSLEVERHPVTGQGLKGIQPPMWHDIVNLGKVAALAFLPSKCLGWDIAVSPAGPVLIEANPYWDPHSDMGQGLPYFRAEPSGLLRKWRDWTKAWDLRRWLGANRSDSRRYREDEQQRLRRKDKLHVSLVAKQATSKIDS